jgi:hypothetical protein
MSYPMVERRVREGRLFLHAWYYVIEDGQVLVLDAERGSFVPVELPRAEADAAPAVRVNEIDAAHWFRRPPTPG